MIHLVNGGSTLTTLKTCDIPGEKYSIDDFLMEGPVTEGLSTTSSWEFRAEYLERVFAITTTEYLNGNAEREKVLARALGHDEIVLWFEFDLFCQANLLYFLNWFASRNLGRARLMLICHPTRHLGELNRSEIEALYPGREEVTPVQKQTAQKVWKAYGNADPRAIEQVLREDLSSLPSLAPALETHLERFPSVQNGLGILGQRTLEILDKEPLEFRDLFPRVYRAVGIQRHGMGDSQLDAYLKLWATAKVPLVQRNGQISITEAGRKLLQMEVDAIELNGIDIWYGGAHITSQNQWRWNSVGKKLERV